uniref:Uncharacterized protein n=1 Tax=Physcomitrium patens TaxID=3218 RepID=A0A7I4AQ18_PHYPA
MSSIGEGNITFWQRLKRQKHGLGNMALAASTLLLAVRLIDQDKELNRMRERESELLEAFRCENRDVLERFSRFRASLEEEIDRAGSRLPPLSTRLRELIEKSNREEQASLASFGNQQGKSKFREIANQRGTASQNQSQLHGLMGRSAEIARLC